MRTGAGQHQRQRAPVDPVYQQPVAEYVQLPVALPVAGQGMVPIPGGQQRRILPHYRVHRFRKQGYVIVLADVSSVVALELGRAFDVSQWSHRPGPP